MIKNSKRESDSLLQALSLFTKLYHKPLSIEGLIHGLPISEGESLFSLKNSKSLMSRAASKAGLKTTLIKKDLDNISTLFLPMIILLKNKEAYILESISDDHKKFKIIYPQENGNNGGSEWIEKEKLEKEYSGFGYLLKREYNYEEFDHKKVNLDTKHWFWSSIKYSANIYRDVLLATILINIFVLATPLFTRNVYNRIIPNNAVDTLWYFAGGVFVIYILDIFLKFTRTFFLELAARKSDIIMSSIIFEKVLDTKYSLFPKSIGSFASNLKDFDSIRSFLTSTTITALVDMPFSILFLIVIWYLGGVIVWIPIITIFLILGYSLAIRKPLYKKIEKTHQAAAQKNGILVEALYNLDTIKTLGASSKIQWRWEEATAEIAKKSMSSRLLSSSIPTITSFLIQFNSISVVVAGVYLIKDGFMTMGDLIAIVILISRTIAPMGQAASLIANYEDTKSVYNIMNQIVKQPVERPKDKEFVSKNKINGKIQFKNINFSYSEDNQKILQNISFLINPKEKVGIIGKMGSGKSTILKLLMNLYEPSTGSILIDDIDISQIDPADLRSNIGYVDQNIKFFRGTLKENIKFSSPYINDEKMIEIAKISGVHDFVIKHPKGYDMDIFEQGMGLSGGQKQSVAIARALVKDPPILIMDEPTNAMDAHSESILIKNLKEYSKDKTLIISTQKLSILEIVDRVIVLNDGYIYLDGKRDEILKKLKGSKGV